MNDRQELVARYVSQRSQVNRDAVIAAHMYLCKRGARKFRRSGSEPADLEQVAAIGLVKAAGAYLAERTTPFEAYAWIVIVGELMHYVRDCERAIRLPRWLRAVDRQYLRAWEALAAHQQAEPTMRQLADALDVDLEVVGQLQALRGGDGCIDERSAPPRIDGLPAPAAGVSLEERLTIVMAIDELTEREKTIVLGTFGAGLSQAEIAALLRVSQSQVSKILARALGKLSTKVA
jgi:RNA polymerase sigma-B factor